EARHAPGRRAPRGRRRHARLRDRRDDHLTAASSYRATSIAPPHGTLTLRSRPRLPTRTIRSPQRTAHGTAPSQIALPSTNTRWPFADAGVRRTPRFGGGLGRTGGTSARLV